MLRYFAVRAAKIKIRKLRGKWWVFISGDMPDFSKHNHFTDALAKVFFELRVGSQVLEMPKR
jgi:hypothetical protein